MELSYRNRGYEGVLPNDPNLLKNLEEYYTGRLAGLPDLKFLAEAYSIRPTLPTELVASDWKYLFKGRSIEANNGFRKVIWSCPEGLNYCHLTKEKYCRLTEENNLFVILKNGKLKRLRLISQVRSSPGDFIIDYSWEEKTYDLGVMGVFKRKNGSSYLLTLYGEIYLLDSYPQEVTKVNYFSIAHCPSLGGQPDEPKCITREVNWGSMCKIITEQDNMLITLGRDSRLYFTRLHGSEWLIATMLICQSPVVSEYRISGTEIIVLTENKDVLKYNIADPVEMKLDSKVQRFFNRS
ncbi:Hypothetical protein HVR_LOCUS274 [uncultured virus]|nr:Hypothetical protein HVR_LOCUS274 [uncultured virus]